MLIGALIAVVVAGIILAVQHWGDISKWLTGVWHNVSVWFEGFWAGIVKLFGNIGGWFHDKWTEAYNGVTGAFSNAGKWFSDLWNTIITDATNAGSSIVKGIADGISGAIKFVQDAIHNVTQWISDHLPHSPAKVGPLRDLAFQGSMITQQISEGMLASMPKLNASLAMLVKPISTSLAPASIAPSSNYASLGFGSNQQPNIYVNVESPDLILDGEKVTQKIGPRVVKGARVNGPLRSGL